MPISVDVKLKGVESLKKKQVNDVLKAAMYALGLRWRRRYLPLHFGNAASRRYGYTPRAGERGAGRRQTFDRSYTGRKLKFLKHTRPLEFTGEGKRQALNGARLVYATRDKVRIPLPTKFNWRHPKSRVRMADEIRAVTAGESKELTAFLVETIDRLLSKTGAAGAGVDTAELRSI